MIATPQNKLDVSRAELRPRPHNPSRRETFYPVTCNRCGSERWLRKNDALKAPEICGRCQRSDAGKIGYRVTAQRYGADFAIKFMQQYRLTHPSKPEREVSALLDLLGVDYEREVRLDLEGGDRYLLDFVIRLAGSPCSAIQVNGWQHTREKVAIRDRKLAEEIPYPLLVIDLNKTGKVVPHELARFVGVLGW